jgi:hypothetical protein
VTRRLAPIIGLVALLCPVLAKAQTNLDQGKSASQIFANACVECHKEPRGLAKGRSASALTEFLREHYTTNAQQAAQLAAYVLGGRSADTAPPAPPAQGRTKPMPERASAEEPKPNRQGRTPSGKPDERSTRSPAREAARPSEQTSPNEQPTIMRPVVGPPPTAHNRRKDQRVPAPTPSEPDTGGMQAPAAAAAEPAGSSEPASREPAREQSAPVTSTVPAEAAPAPSAPAASGDSAVPRDHIPD